MAEGIAPSKLDDEALERELRRLHETRSETFFNGSADALAAHTNRMFDLEDEYANRHPERVAPDPMRVQATNRQATGQG